MVSVSAATVRELNIILKCWLNKKLSNCIALQIKK